MTETLIVAPHPDDETLACAGIIQTAVQQNHSLAVAVVTNGDGHPKAASQYFDCREEDLTKEHHLQFAAVMQQELMSSLAILGLGSDAVTFLGYPGGGYLIEVAATKEHPICSRFTGLSHTFAARYPDYHSQRTGAAAPYTKTSMVDDFRHLLLTHHPQKIFLPHPADGHWDHQVVAALFEELYAVMDHIPDVYYYLIHSGMPRINKYKRYWPPPPWPAKRAAPTMPYAAVSVDEGTFPMGVSWPPDVHFPVPDPQQKLRAIEAYRSVRAIDKKDFLIAFVKSDEVFWLRPKIERITA